MTTPLQLVKLLINRLAYSLVFILTISLPFTSQAQQTNNWYFGSAAGFANTGLRVDFTSGSPVVSTGIPMLTEEGSSSISDASGNPLFYTNGIRMYDASTNAIFGGVMNGGSSSTQSAVIMPKPGSTNQWLVFTSGDNGSPGLSYYTVTGTGSPGVSPFTLSAATNLVAAGAAGEGMSIIGSTKAGSSFWVVVRDVAATGVVRTFDVSNTGVVNATPVTSVLSGPAFTNTSYTSTIGTIKSNTCQNKLAFTYLNADVDLVDFDAATGQVVANTAKRINVVSGGGDSGSYGIEFSTNDAYLYITNLAGGNVYRYTLASNTIAGFGGGIAAGNEAGQLQAAPDGKIYMANRNASPATAPNYLASINAPNTAGATFTAQAVLLSGVTYAGNFGFVYRGLPTFPKSLVVGSLILSPGDGAYCVGDVIPLSFTFSGAANTATYLWTATGGGQTFTTGGASSTIASPTVAFSTTGAKTVTFYLEDICGRSYTKTMNFQIDSPKSPVGSVTCSSPNIILSNTTSDPDAPNYIWYRNSVGTSNIMGTGSPLSYTIGNDASRPTQVCLGVSSTTPALTTASNKTIAGSNTLGGIFAMSPYTSPTFDVLADNILLKSFKFGFRYSTFYGPLNITYTIKQGATTIFTNTLTAIMIPDGSIYTAAVNTTIQKGTGYTITVSTNKDGLEMQSSTWLGATNAGEITYNGGAGSGYAIASLNYDAHTYTITPACSAHPCYPVSCSLPVEWVFVNAKKSGAAVNVKWAVAMELNNDHFEVQRSLDGLNFTTIGTVEGRGNGTSYKEYSYLDQSVPAGTIYYRIVQFDYDGTNMNSNIVTVNTSDLSDLISIYPNPSNNEFNMEWFAEAPAQYQVFDVRGTVVTAGTLDASKGPETVGDNFLAGVYIVKVFAASQTYNFKLIKQ
jgi:hypothetical protein